MRSDAALLLLGAAALTLVLTPSGAAARLVGAPSAAAAVAPTAPPSPAPVPLPTDLPGGRLERAGLAPSPPGDRPWGAGRPQSEEGDAAATEVAPAPTEQPAQQPAGQPAGDTAWSPRAPLPAPATGAQPVDVVLSPHPDDETLSLGVWIANAVARGDRVIVVSLTDGRTTGAITTVSQRLRRPVTPDEIGTARLRELDAAAAQLGVRPGDVYPAHLDAPASPGADLVTVAEARAVVDAFARQFPDATFATMSWTAERHRDHLAAGIALRDAAADGTVRRAVFAVSRLWWHLPSPPVTVVLPETPAARRRVVLAAAAYDLWDPALHRLAVGWTSVHEQFTALVADPRDRVHG